MIIMKNYGMIGYLRLFKNCYCTCETKEEGEKYDLRITEPFPELQALVDTYDTDNLEIQDHKFVPFIVILIQELQKWKNAVKNFLLTNFSA